MEDREGSVKRNISPQIEAALAKYAPYVKHFPPRRKLTQEERVAQTEIDQERAREFNERNKDKRGGKNVSTRKHKKNKQHKPRKPCTKSNKHKQTHRKSIRRRR